MEMKVMTYHIVSWESLKVSLHMPYHSMTRCFHLKQQNRYKSEHHHGWAVQFSWNFLEAKICKKSINAGKHKHITNYLRVTYIKYQTFHDRELHKVTQNLINFHQLSLIRTLPVSTMQTMKVNYKLVSIVLFFLSENSYLHSCSQ